MRTETRQRVPRRDPPQNEPAATDFFDGVDRARALRAPARDEVSERVACAIEPPIERTDPISMEPPWDTLLCAAGYPSLSNPYGAWTTDMSPAPPKQKPVRVAPPSTMAGMVQAIHHVLHGRIDPSSRIEHRELWQSYARSLIQRADPLGNVIGRAVLGDPIHSWFKGIDGAQQLGGLTRLGAWMDARWDRGLRIDLDGNQPAWTALERVTTEFAFLRLYVHDLQPRLLNIVGETPRMQSLTFTNQNLDRLDLATIERFGPLTALDLEGFTIRDLVPMRAHHRIEQVRLAACRGDLDLAVLKGNKELIDLHVESCPTVRGWKALPAFPSLRRLGVGGQVEWTTVRALTDCTRVTSLALADLEFVDDLGPLLTMPALETLALTNTGITDLQPLPELAALRELTLSHNHQLADFAALADCATIESLTLRRLGWLRDTSPVVRLPELRTLTIAKCRRLTELARFPAGSALEELTLVGCPAIDGLHGIATCGRLRVVRLAGTSVATVRDLLGLPNLEAVVLLDPERDPKMLEALRRVRAIERSAEELAPDHPAARAWLLPSGSERGEA